MDNAKEFRMLKGYLDTWCDIHYLPFRDWMPCCFYEGFPGSSVGKESACNAGDSSSIPGLGRSTGEGIGYPLHYSWSSLVVQLVICPQCRRPGFNPCVGKIPCRREQLPTPVFWPGEFHGLYSPRGCKESNTTEWLSRHFTLLTCKSLFKSWDFPSGPVVTIAFPMLGCEFDP